MKRSLVFFLLILPQVGFASSASTAVDWVGLGMENLRGFGVAPCGCFLEATPYFAEEKTEVKVFLQCTPEIEAAMQGQGDLLNRKEREVYFSDTVAKDFNAAKVALRRRQEGTTNEFTVKIKFDAANPYTATSVPREWRQKDGVGGQEFKCEPDRSGEEAVMACSFTVSPASRMTDEQIRFLKTIRPGVAAFLPLTPEMERPKVASQQWVFNQEGARGFMVQNDRGERRKVNIEKWTFADGSCAFEASTKVPSSEAEVAMTLLRAKFTAVLETNQTTKTVRALEVKAPAATSN